MTKELTKAAQQALEACPFCGSTNIKVHSYNDAVIGGEPDAFAQCHDCSVTGPNGKTEAEAVAAWNTRALTTSQPAAQATPAQDVGASADYWGDLAQQKADADARRGVSMPVSYYTSSIVGALLATQQATPEPVTLGPLAKRNIYDAIRGAYDLGYNDARNARTVPGDSAPGYEGRSVEEDHGGALFNLLSRRLKTATPPQQAAGEPVGEAVYIAKGHLREVLNGNTMNAYLSPEPDRFADVALFTRPAPGVPEGFALVPVEPTDEIRQAFFRELSGAACSYFDDDSDPSGGFAQAWRNALAAAQAKGADHD